MNTNVVKVAAAQYAPHFLNLDKTVEKTCNLISEAGKNGTKLIVFPEAFISGYPDWVWLIPNGHSTVLDDLYQELVQNAVTIPDKTTQKLCQAAKEAGVYVVVGIHERNSEASGFTLYNTLLYINNLGEIIGKHRKLIPTGGERMVWGQGNGDTLSAFNTDFGKLGGLICWENYMPLARQGMYSAGTEVYVAPTWDSSENWLLSMRHIAREGGMFVISVCQAVRKDDIPDRFEFKQLYSDNSEWINSGNSCIINPRGDIIAGPVSNKQEMLYADIDLSLIAKSKRMFDVTGHYSRPDVFRYEINKS